MAYEIRTQLPQEIWLMICEELMRLNDFNGLFTCARVSQGLASVSLPLLYSVQENSPASTGEATYFDKRKWARLWRTIILSSTGATAHPYCLWIKALKLGNLENLLEDLIIAANVQIKDLFFEHPMEDFYIVKGGAMTRRSRGPLLDIQSIVEKVGDTVTEFVKEAADREHKSVTLAALEGYRIPLTVLPKWISKLSLLTSLTLRNGSDLGAEAAAAIRDNCPYFKDIVCHYCPGTHADKGMASFLDGLPRNTLEAFTLISQNDIGKETLRALSQHSLSLKRLHLSSLQSNAIQNLNLLEKCKGIEELTLEAMVRSWSLEWEAEHKDAFLQVIAWLKQCASLRRLAMYQVPNGASLLAEVLQSTSLRLEDLRIKLIDDDAALYSALGQQTALKGLSLKGYDDAFELSDPRRLELIHSVCQSRDLRSLDLATAALTYLDLTHICSCLGLLEDFSFDCDLLDDGLWMLVERLGRLKALSINGLTSFTFEGILGYIRLLEQDVPSHRGFRLDIASQLGEIKFSWQEGLVMTTEMARLLEGRLEITYYRDEESESELSE